MAGTTNQCAQRPQPNTKAADDEKHLHNVPGTLPGFHDCDSKFQVSFELHEQANNSEPALRCIHSSSLDTHFYEVEHPKRSNSGERPAGLCAFSQGDRREMEVDSSCITSYLGVDRSHSSG